MLNIALCSGRQGGGRSCFLESQNAKGICVEGDQTAGSPKSPIVLLISFGIQRQGHLVSRLAFKHDHIDVNLKGVRWHVPLDSRLWGGLYIERCHRT